MIDGESKGFGASEVVRKFTSVITTEGGDPGGDGGDPGGDGGDPGSGDPGADDLSTLFSAEDIAERKTSIADAATEETRRAALSEDERATEDTAAVEAGKLNEIPEAYDFKMPEGFESDEGVMTSVEQFAKDNKLSVGAAAQLSEIAGNLIVSLNGSRETQFETVKEGWLESAKTDPEIGADISKGAESVAARAFNTIATPEMKALVDQYGIGNHPEMLRMFYRLSSLMGDDKMLMSGTGAGGGSDNSVASTVGSMFNHPSRNK